MSNNIISHEGVIDSINASTVNVRIVQSSACSGCKLSSHCTSAESKEKLIEVRTYDTSRYKIGDNVNVLAATAVGFKAVLYAFIIPLVLLTVSIFAMLLIVKSSEIMAIGVGFAILASYYTLLYIMRSKLEKQLTFYLED